ncbi:MAG: glucosyltransferase domain-containing protein [Christensenella sp.]
MMFNSPEKMLGTAYGMISKESKKAFVSACIIGFITHFYAFANLMFNYDSALSFGHNIEGTASGRWSLKWATSLSGNLQMPAVIMLYSIIFLALTAVCVVAVLKIHSTGGIVLTSGFIVTFPTVVCTVSYVFTADAYFLSMFLAAFCVWITTKYKYGFLPASLILAVSVGIYQAYFCMAAALFVLRAILDLVEENLSWKEIWLRIARYLIVLIGGLILYYGILQLMLVIKHTSLSNYRSINQMGKFDILKLPVLIKETIYEVYAYFCKMDKFSFISRFVVWMQRIVCVAVPSLLLFLCLYKKGKKPWLKIMLAWIALAMFPIAANLMHILNPQEVPHILMIYAFVLLFVFFVKLAELATDWISNINCKAILAWCSGILCVVLVFQSYILTNSSYFRLQISDNETYLFASRIVQRIEMQESYSAQTPIYIVGNLPYENYPKAREGMFKFSDDMTGICSDYFFFSPDQTTEFIENYLGFSLLSATPEQINAIKASDAYRAMPIYPHPESVQTIEGVIVVRMGE